ncbi:hypothetical protein V6N13_117755 [Hibiscus sabdariffa]|uniref:Uncharacterized protein n=1 Tax=Hibiscus sabdariffa TaxID=183260 RepID=A0ABR2Q9U9_9ROSI
MREKERGCGGERVDGSGAPNQRRMVNPKPNSLTGYRIPTVYSNSNGLLHQNSGLPENSRLSCRTSPGSLDTVTENGAALAELLTGVEETSSNGESSSL